jgi:ubiquinone/menaquinone biosynthesis C-methylase UbiE
MRLKKENLFIEKNKQGYDSISSDFVATRIEPWPELNQFQSLVKPGDRVLDLGCGHGRLLKLFSGLKIDYHGFDHSAELINVARRDNPGVFFQAGDVRHLPYTDDSFDSIWMIALLHHLPPRASMGTLKEARRVVRCSGKVVITIWQPHSHWTRSWEKIGRRSFRKKWGNVSWIYYYQHQPRKIKKMVKRAGFVIEKDGYTEKRKRRNYFIVATPAPIA